MLRDQAYLIDILESARIALQHLGEKTREQFYYDIKIQDAVIRRLEIIGEAARRVSDETKQMYPNLPWLSMIRMRNFMIHEYDGIDMHIVYETVKTDLPPLIRELEKKFDKR